MIAPDSEQRSGVGLDLDKLGHNSWHDYVIRFAFGGTITALTGVIAHIWGPAVGGLFLAFPAILPASITLVQDHDGKRQAGVDALGAAFGTIGLVIFGIVIWFAASRGTAWLDLLVAGLLWLATSVAVWYVVTRR
ncbi:MAG TPA: DUF3147 family protein [Chloroflexota bacterium]|nr:DUF3147 family protein [Chloroflexota bacterium]